jgi:hypothetical protein
MKKLKRDGIDVQVATNQALNEMVDLSSRYRDKLRALQYSKFGHLNPGLVLSVITLFREIHEILGEILELAEAATRR